LGSGSSYLGETQGPLRKGAPGEESAPVQGKRHGRRGSTILLRQVESSMVRRGSPVRVRKRALTKAPQTQGFCFLDALHFVQRARVWNRFWNSQTKKPRFCCLARHQSDGRATRFGWVVGMTRTRLRKGPGSTWRNHALSGTPPGIVGGLETRRFREGVLPGPGVPSILSNQPRSIERSLG
jgi:hypothetical protein